MTLLPQRPVTSVDLAPPWAEARIGAAVAARGQEVGDFSNPMCRAHDRSPSADWRNGKNRCAGQKVG